MATSRQLLTVILASVLVVLSAAACSGGAASAPASQSAQPTASAASAASAPTSQPAQPTANAASAPAAAPTSTTSSASGGGAGEIVFGGIFNLTGANASQAVLFRNSAELAVKEINDAGGINGKKINLVSEDAQSTNPGALAALSKSIDQDKALVEIGPNMSTQIQAMSDAVKQAGVPFVMAGSAVKNTHMGNPWMIRVVPDDSIGAAAMVQYIKDDMKLTKIGIINDSDAFGGGGADMVEQDIKQQGLTMVKRVQYTAGTKDFTAQLLSIKDAGAQVLVAYPSRPEDAALIVQQYRTLGAPYQFMGDIISGEKDTLDLSKGASDGIYAQVHYMPGITDESKKFLAAYKKEYNADADPATSCYYDGVYLLANAIKTAGEDRAKIQQAVLNVHGWVGNDGTYDFTPNGDGLHSSTIVQIVNGGYKFIKVVTVKPQS